MQMNLENNYCRFVKNNSLLMFLIWFVAKFLH